MHLTTTNILSQLSKEREENSLISKEMLDDTNKWISLFETFPEVGFDLVGDPESYLDFLDNNKPSILETVNKFFNPLTEAATEEEAGVYEGYEEIDEQDQDHNFVPTEPAKSPTITISFEDLSNMFYHMQKVVGEHTKIIYQLQEELDTYKSANQISLPKYVSTEVEFNTTEAFNTVPAAVLPSAPPMLSYEQPQPEVQEHYAPIHEDVSVESIVEETEDDEFDNFSETQAPAKATTATKPKLSKTKKIAIIAVMVLALAAILVALFMPVQKAPQTEPAQMQPPSSVSAVIAPATMANISTAAAITPTYVKPVVQAPVQAVVPAAVPVKKEKPKSDIPKYSENMKTYVKSDNNNTIILAKDEKVIEVEGQDTDNWIFNYKPEKHAIIFYVKTNQLTNTIKIKTNKKTYTLTLISSTKGFTQISLAD